MNKCNLKSHYCQQINALNFFQLNIYKNDFELERTARQEIAGEKEQLLLDLKMLQKRNQALIEDPLLRFLYPHQTNFHKFEIK